VRISTKSRFPAHEIFLAWGWREDFSLYQSIFHCFPVLIERQEIDSVFSPIFKKIRRLVVQQCDAVRENHRAIVKVLFMVGGFGANEYLAQYLTGKISRETKLKTPTFG
jgi:hypothetical protein